MAKFQKHINFYVLFHSKILNPFTVFSNYLYKINKNLEYPIVTYKNMLVPILCLQNLNNRK